MMTKKQVLPQQLLLCSFLILLSTPVQAQITPDNTLSPEASLLTPNIQLRGANTDLINGGAQRGNNLFHSFTQFNINDGQRVYFANPSGVVNILTRVTGNQASNISGILGVDGAANLFLINPVGILFGQNARLDIRGSFVATTANGMQFGNQGVFSATNPEAPPLLNINPSALFFNQISPNSQGIINQILPNSNDAVVTSTFSPQQGSRYWVGGNVTFDAGQWGVTNNRAELGGLVENGSVGLVGNGNQMQLAFPEGVARADVLFKNNAFLSTTGGGAITVNARNFRLSGNSSVGAFLLPGEGQAGVSDANVVVNATGDVTLDGLSQISNIGLQNSLGDTGNITINAQSIRLTNQSFIANNAQRSRGNIILNAKDNISLETNSIINTVGQPNSIGKSGNIEIKAINITLDGDNVFVNASNLHEGKGGDISVVADNSIVINGFASISSTSAGQEDSGDIELQTQSLTLTNGGNIGTQPSGLGNSGNLLINASESVLVSGTTTFDNLQTGQKITTSSRLATNVFGAGKSGQLTVNTKRLSINDGGEITTRTLLSRGGNLTINAKDSVEVAGRSSNASSTISTTTFGSGNAGTLNINTGRLSIRDSGLITTSTSGTGKGGNLTIDARGLVEVVGASLSSPNSVSSIFTGTLGSGDAGDIMITSQDFSVRNGAQVNTGTTAAGKGGNLTVNANGNVEVFGASVNGLVNSRISTSANRGLTGNAGDLTINAQNVLARDSGQVTAVTGGQGKGGNLTVNTLGKLELIGSSAKGILPTTFSTSALIGSSGNAGDMTITSQDLFVRDGAEISASTSGEGKAGNLTINASNLVKLSGASVNGRISGIAASVQPGSTGDAGSLTIKAQDLLVADGARVFTGTFAVGRAGNLTVNAENSIQLAGTSIGGLPGGLVASTENSSSGDAGDLIVNTRNLLARDGAGVFVNSNGTGNAGILTMNANITRLDNKASFNANTRSPNKDPNREQATINLNTQALIMRRGSNITTNAIGANVIGGNININADVLAAFEDSDIGANSTNFRGGRVRITSQGIFGTQTRNFQTLQSDITATGASPDLIGSTEINTPDVDSTQAIIELPEEVVDATRRVAQICPVNPGDKLIGEFTITGRGSLPPNPLEPLSGTTNTTKLATLESNNTSNHIIPYREQNQQNAIIEAQGWMKTTDGSVELVAMAPQATPTARSSVPNCSTGVSPVR
jgi:filamentous hemagglutinin family protein